jgi:hypothetical protein
MELTRGYGCCVGDIFLVLMAFMSTSRRARPLGGNGWASQREAISSDGVVQLLRQIYLQKLGAGLSCGTNSSHGGYPRRIL